MRYAKDTEVSADRTRAEIEKTLIRYGATSFLYGSETAGAVIMFEFQKRQVRFLLKLASRDSFYQSPTGRSRTQSSAEAAYDKAVRQKWRALLLIIKGRLEGIESDIESFERAFMSYIMLPNGQTVADWLQPQIKEALETGRMPKMIPQLTA